MPNPTPPALHIGHLSDRGQRREVNEDHYWIPTPEVDPAALARKGRLFLVADGMGGHQGGQRASQLAASIVPQVYYGAAGGDAAQSLRQALQAANDEIVREARANAALHNMGTTAVAAVIQGNRLTIAHVGDSRAYRLRSGQLSQLTSDHSFVEEGISRGQITLEDAATHPYRGVITRALGARPELQPDVRELDWLPGDQLLLCSDGLSNLAPPEEIAAVLGSRGAQQAAQRLVDMANHNGGPDNITAIVVSYGGAAAVAKSPLPLVFGGVAALAVVLLVAIPFILSRLNGTPEPTAAAQATVVVTSAPTGGGEPAGGQEASPAAAGPASEETGQGASDEGGAPTVAPEEEVVAAITTTVAVATTAPPVATTPPPGTPTALPPTATPLPPTPLAAPELQGPSEGETVPERVEFRWVSVQYAAGFQVETRSDRPGQTDWRPWTRLSGGETTYNLTFADAADYFAIPGTIYSWRVAALDAAGRPTYSAVRTFVMQRAQAATPTPRPTDTPVPTPLAPTEEPPEEPPVEPPIQPPITDTLTLDSIVVYPGDMSGLTLAGLQHSEASALSDRQPAMPSTQSFVFLPLVQRTGGIPAAPVLNAIQNPDGDGAYEVQWSAAVSATYYLLEEAHDLSFSGASEVYSGNQQSYAVSDRGAARYYYRVRAGNTDWQTPWSEAQYTDVLWEKEPNNVFTQANGPLVSGLTYRGRFDPSTDLNDYYLFDLTETHDIEVWLTHIAPGENYDLILRNDAGQIPGGYSGQLGNADEYVHLTQQLPGRYYARVFNRSGTVSQQPYQLRVVYMSDP